MTTWVGGIFTAIQFHQWAKVNSSALRTEVCGGQNR